MTSYMFSCPRVLILKCYKELGKLPETHHSLRNYKARESYLQKRLTSCTQGTVWHHFNCALFK